MCGFAGYLSNTIKANENIVMDMVKNVNNRGPDSEGLWIDSKNSFAVAHKRLSILELSDAGNQPILSSNKRYVLAFNGEIYNHLDIRETINKKFEYSWCGRSDTETLIQSISFLGLNNTLNLINGMFSFVLWDRDEKKLILVRDRLGEKPLFYGIVGDSLIFGSELKCFKNFPNWQKKIDKKSLDIYFRYGYIPSPHCIFENFYKLEPGCMITIEKENLKNFKKSKYWDIDEKIHDAQSSKVNNSDKFDNRQYEKKIEEKLKNSIKQRLVSDVPIGAFLSGGVDSATVVSMMQFSTSTPIKTFTIGFKDKNYCEASKAKKISQFLGTDHREIIIEDKKLIDLIDKIGSVWDEPFSDISQVPALLLSYKARKDVKVVLSGDGGDELFCGYNRYLKGLDFHKLLNHKFISKNIFRSLRSKSKFFENFIKENDRERFEKFLMSFKSKNLNEYYENVVKIYENNDSLLKEKSFDESFFAKYKIKIDHLSFEEKLMYLDLKQYLPENIMTKVDRASMKIGLEARSPFLDHEVVEFSFQIPLKYKKMKGRGKKIIRNILSNYIPESYVDKDKIGFSVPIKSWLLGPLKSWSEFLIEEEKKNKQSIFNSTRLNQLISEDYYEFRKYQKLWTVLMFLSWKKSFLDD